MLALSLLRDSTASDSLLGAGAEKSAEAGPLCYFKYKACVNSMKLHYAVQREVTHSTDNTADSNK